MTYSHFCFHLEKYYKTQNHFSHPRWSQNTYIALYLLKSLFAKDKDFPTDIKLHITKL